MFCGTYTKILLVLSTDPIVLCLQYYVNVIIVTALYKYKSIYSPVKVQV